MVGGLGTGETSEDPHLGPTDEGPFRPDTVWVTGGPPSEWGTVRGVRTRASDRVKGFGVEDGPHHVGVDYRGLVTPTT